MAREYVLYKPERKEKKKILLISLFGIIWKHMTCLPFILGDTDTINPELKHSIKRVCVCVRTHTDTHTPQHTPSKQRVVALQAGQRSVPSSLIRSKSYDCSDDKFINKQISTSGPINQTLHYHGYLANNLLPNREPQCDWLTSDRGGADVSSTGGRACVLTRALYICERK